LCYAWHCRAFVSRICPTRTFGETCLRPWVVLPSWGLCLSPVGNSSAYVHRRANQLPMLYPSDPPQAGTQRTSLLAAARGGVRYIAPRRSAHRLVPQCFWGSLFMLCCYPEVPREGMLINQPTRDHRWRARYSLGAAQMASCPKLNKHLRSDNRAIL
jgi:hypothetical protein